MSFEQRLEEMQKLYMDTERQFQEVTYVIPIDNSPHVYSPRLYSILQLSCAQIDSLFKIICGQLGIEIVNKKFPEFYKTLNENKMLQKQEVFLLERKIFLHPFNETGKHKWWTGYNDTTHELPEGIVQGTLGNVLDSMAAVFLLNNIANLTKWYAKDTERFLDGENWHREKWDRIDAGTIAYMTQFNTQSPIKNSLFFHLNSNYHSGQGL